ncbi:hypothetical protein BCR37DRAFT_378622 [Protomyces lactucae-debilis]|uniref:Uncharacterized protein n=1 Tax=Protomyces lactucae-debilis TaxID=2754530 RepID=A0A1Y2FI83_PROLT|nr:uncharacterized protein BCR37DRAFT_378622 [Protomyces lactucae-debilis]ORY83660.1 hypothetical protein BCR37DRAFT_378622 [Protomyces lactucae-debilis]
MSNKNHHQHHKAFTIAQHQARQARRKSSTHAQRPTLHQAPALQQRASVQHGQSMDMNVYGDSDDADTETDEEPETAKRTAAITMTAPSAAQQETASPLKRKRAMSMSELFDFPDSPPASDGGSMTPGSQSQYHFDDIAALDESEDEYDMERMESAELIHEREDDDMRGHKFHVMDDDKPFAYAPEEEDQEAATPSEQGSRSEEYWLEDFDALLNGASLFEIDASNSANNRHIEPSQDSLLEQEFFVHGNSSSSDQDEDEENDDDDDDDEEEDDEDGDDDERIGWDCFFANGDSDSETEMELEAMAQQAIAEEELAQALFLTSQVMDMPDQVDGDSDASTTDDEAPELLLQRSNSKLNPMTPARALVKSNLTSCMKQASFIDDTTPTKAAGQYLLNTSTDLTTPNQAPLLGTWTRDTTRPVAVIDGSTTNSPAHTPPLPKAAPVMSGMTGIKLTPAAALAAATEASKIANAKLKRAKAYRRSEAMTAAITSLDDIMYTNDFLLPGEADAHGHSVAPLELTPTIAAPGAFRRHQQNRTNVHKEDSLKDEWILLTSKSKAARDTRKVSAVPVLGLGTDSLSRKEKRRRKKLKTAAAGAGGLGRIGGSALSMDGDYSTGEDEVFGVERAGLGMGPPLESLFSF